MQGIARQPICIASLEAYLSRNVEEIRRPILLEQFEFGQSNPTYLIIASDNSKYVLRKKPPGILVSKIAHQVEREFQVIQALENTNVPVPKVYCLCEDENVIGTSFYIMEFLDGRIIKDPSMPGLTPVERKEMWYDAVRTLGKLHNINPPDIGLQTLGKSYGFYDRQIKTFGKICKAQAVIEDVDTKTPVGSIPHLEEMLHYFSDKKTQPKDRNSLIHGDYKIDNLIYHLTEPRVIGILDWEMSTLGHPLSDLINLITPYSLVNQIRVPLFPEFSPTTTPGLPKIEELSKLYHEITGWEPGPDLMWGTAFGFFRMTAISQGIASRYATRQASSAKAKEMAEARHPAGHLAWEQVLKCIENGKCDTKI